MLLVCFLLFFYYDSLVLHSLLVLTVHQGLLFSLGDLTSLSPVSSTVDSKPQSSQENLILSPFKWVKDNVQYKGLGLALAATLTHTFT